VIHCVGSPFLIFEVWGCGPFSEIYPTVQRCHPQLEVFLYERILSSSGLAYARYELFSFGNRGTRFGPRKLDVSLSKPNMV
jgi:hypothetical protein